MDNAAVNFIQSKESENCVLTMVEQSTHKSTLNATFNARKAYIWHAAWPMVYVIVNGNSLFKRLLL